MTWIRHGSVRPGGLDQLIDDGLQLPLDLWIDQEHTALQDPRHGLPVRLPRWPSAPCSSTGESSSMGGSPTPAPTSPESSPACGTAASHLESCQGEGTLSSRSPADGSA